MHRALFRTLVVAALVIAGAPAFARISLGGPVAKHVPVHRAHHRTVRNAQATATPPIVIGMWAPGGGLFCCGVNDADPGAIPDQHLFAGIIDFSYLVNGAGATLETNCPGPGVSGNVSGCVPTHYVNVIHLLCSFSVTLAAYEWANANDEGAFLHNYSGTRTSTNRYPFANTSGFQCSRRAVTATPTS